jgi:drug/metabolite transporter (DMT)-like permease
MDVALIGACITYTLAGSLEYWLLNWLSSIFSIRLPIFSALIQNSSWPLQAVVYYFQRKSQEKLNGPRTITRQMHSGYIILGSLNCIISLCRMIGLTTLPPTVYVVTANTEILFEALLTRFYLGREVSCLQICSVICVILGVTISLYQSNSSRPSNDDDGDDKRSGATELSIVWGVLISVFSRFASSLNTVLADK